MHNIFVKIQVEKCRDTERNVDYRLFINGETITKHLLFMDVINTIKDEIKDLIPYKDIIGKGENNGKESTNESNNANELRG